MRPVWFLAFEAWAVSRLLRSSAFHRGVQKVHRVVNRLPPEEKLTEIEKTGPSLLRLFREEIQAQLKGGDKRPPK